MPLLKVCTTLCIYVTSGAGGTHAVHSSSSWGWLPEAVTASTDRWQHISSDGPFSKWCENGSQAATTEQRWWICPRLMRQLVGRWGIVFLSLGMHWVICSSRGDAIPFHPSSNGCLTTADARIAPSPFLSTLLAFSKHGPPLLQMCPYSLIWCQIANNHVVKAHSA